MYEAIDETETKFEVENTGYAKTIEATRRLEGTKDRPTTSEVLEERGSRYGEYSDVAKTSQSIKDCYGDRLTYESTTIESLDMIANKIARIVNGDRDYEDNWVDIMGYAQLELDAIRRRVK